MRTCNDGREYSFEDRFNVRRLLFDREVRATVNGHANDRQRRLYDCPRETLTDVGIR